MTQLLEPLTFQNGVRAPNRVVLAAMTNQQSLPDGKLGEDELRWLRMRAEGGFGIVSTCAAHVARDGQGWAGELGIFDDAQVPGLQRISDVVHAKGGLAFAQIFHGGLRADAQVSGLPAWSASEDPATGARAATTEDVERVVRQFAEAAVRAHAAGMDGVEIHGAHGYLLTQFLSRVDNRRTDAWGGSLENRARLMREVTRAVRASVPDSFVVGMRLSPEDAGNAKGLDLDENLEVARWLVQDGVDFLHLSLWDARKATTKRPHEHALTLFRETVRPEVRLFAAGSVWTREEGQQVLDLGADAVALARAAIINPDWPRRIEDAAWQPTRPPVTGEFLEARGLSPAFVNYLRGRKNFVS